MNFSQSKYFSSLTRLAQHAPQLNEAGLLNAERIKKYVVHSLSFKMLYATEKIDDDIISQLSNLANELGVVKKMHQLQEMSVMNYVSGVASENRRVGHTAMRQIFSQTSLTKEQETATEQARTEWNKLKNFIAKHDLSWVKHIIVVGIGGSYLGTQAAWEALKAFKQTDRTLEFISNVDPDNAAAVLAKVNLAHSLILIISKSGDTLEVKANEDLLRTIVSAHGLDPSQHFIAVTGQNSPLDNPQNFLQSFYLWDFVGGRFSLSSMVGLVPLALTLGLEVTEQVLTGAHEMDQVALEHNSSHNLPLLIALLTLWNRNFLNIPSVAVIPYSASLWRYPAHLQQLFMESNGKSSDQQAQFINYASSPLYWGEVGTDSQHSFFQQLHQGTDRVSVEFITFKKAQSSLDRQFDSSFSQQKLLANLLAQSLSLAQGKADSNPNKYFAGDRPNRILIADCLTPRVFGQLLSLHEHVVAFYGFLLGINSFDQEGVQLGKKITAQILEHLNQKNLGDDDSAISAIINIALANDSPANQTLN